MKAIIRNIHSPDIDLTSGQVEDSLNFSLLIQLIVGPADGPGEESFDVVVCTPAWIAHAVKEHGPLIGRHYLITDRYDIVRIANYLRQYIESLEADTWQGLAEKIGRIGKWEFEDYSG
ncbi:immunity 8 family protein [Micromonospora sp. CPCC 205371]|nr:immunity 8 family protein [Micromonospora sp. CPCC 205371]